MQDPEATKGRHPGGRRRRHKQVDDRVQTDRSGRPGHRNRGTAAVQIETGGGRRTEASLDCSEVVAFVEVEVHNRTDKRSDYTVYLALVAPEGSTGTTVLVAVRRVGTLHARVRYQTRLQCTPD